MTHKTTMPEPVAEIYSELRTSGAYSPPRKELRLRWLISKMPEEGSRLITTTQAEAYADARVRESQQWHPIDSAPHETLVVLGWYDENEVFKQEIALASAGRRYPGGASDMWWHGRATHWMPLPAPPLPEPM